MAQLALINAKFKDATDSYKTRREEREFVNAMFYRGYQVPGAFSDYDPAEDEIVRTHNIIRPIVRAATAATLRQMPNVAVPAARDDMTAMKRARNTELLCKSWTRSGVIDWMELHRAVSWSKQCGLGFLKVFWNPDGGRMVKIEESIDPGMGKDPDQWWEAEEASENYERDIMGERIMPYEPEGEIETCFVSSADAVVMPSARTWKEVKHLFHIKMRTVEELRDEFPTDFFGRDIEGFDTGTIAGAPSRMRTMQTGSGGAVLDGNTSDGNLLAAVTEFWELPCKRYPNGRFCVFSGGTMLYYGPNPYFPTRIPFVPFYGDNIVPGSLYPDGLVEDLRDPQRSVNFGVSKTEAILDLMVNPKWLVPIGSMVDQDAFDNKVGGIIEYQMGKRPEPANFNDVPVSLFDFVNENIERHNKISGYSDVARGDNSTSKAESGRMVALLSQGERTTREPELIQHQISIRDMFQQGIHLARQFYDDGRIIRMVGENNSWTVREFLSADFDLDNDVVIEVDSGAPQGSAERFSEVLELAAAGVLDDGPVAERARRMLGDRYVGASTSDPFEPLRQFVHRQMEEIIADPGAQPMAPSFVAKADVCLEEIDKFRISVDYARLPDYTRARIDMLAESYGNLDEAQEINLAQREALMAGGGASQPGDLPPQGASAPSMAGAESPMDGGSSQAPDLVAPTAAEVVKDPYVAASLEQS